MIDENKVRELAYFNWLNRGCPQGDPETDWYTAEQQEAKEETQVWDTMHDSLSKVAPPGTIMITEGFMTFPDLNESTVQENVPVQEDNPETSKILKSSKIPQFAEILTMAGVKLKGMPRKDNGKERQTKKAARNQKRR